MEFELTGRLVPNWFLIHAVNVLLPDVEVKVKLDGSEGPAVQVQLDTNVEFSKIQYSVGAFVAEEEREIVGLLVGELVVI